MSTEPRTFTGRTMIGVRPETRRKIQAIADFNRWPLSTALDVLADYWLQTHDTHATGAPVASDASERA